MPIFLLLHRVNSCPTKVYKYDEDTKKVEIEDALRCMYCKECKKKAEDFGRPDMVSIQPKSDRFIFTVEVIVHCELSLIINRQQGACVLKRYFCMR
jgi:hypothetical protein